MQQKNHDIKCKTIGSGIWEIFKDMRVLTILLFLLLQFNYAILSAQENNGEGRLLEGDILEDAAEKIDNTDI